MPPGDPHLTALRVRQGARIPLAAALVALLCLAFFWPGIAMYDSLTQYRQVLSGVYDDWHPPAMARLWAAFHAAGWSGQGPMFALQMLLWWSGLGALAAGLARTNSLSPSGRGLGTEAACPDPAAAASEAISGPSPNPLREGERAFGAIAVLLIGLWPPFLGWQASVLKDAQMAGALLAASGAVAWWRLRGERVPGWGVALVGVLLAYATLVRVNAVFASVPLAYGLFGRWERPVLRGGLVLATMVAVLAATPFVNHQLLSAAPSGVERSLMTYDLAGIAHHAGPGAVAVLPAGTWRQVEARGCLTPVLWDALGDADRCGFVADRLAETAPGGALVQAWAGAILHHPLAYAAHRLKHWNATMRLWVPFHYPLAGPQASSESNDVGLASPGARVEPFQQLAGWLADGPTGAPAPWLALACAVLGTARPSRGERGRLAVALALSAVLTELGFLIVSIASDYRYHLWAMVAAALAAILVSDRRWPRGAVAGVGLVFLVALVARLVLPPLGDSYRAAIGL